MSGRDLSDVLLLIPCCKRKRGNGLHPPAIVSPPLNSELSPSALTMLNEGRSQVVDQHRDAFDFTRDVRPAMVWYTGIMYETTGFRDALDAAFERGLHCLIVSAGYGLLRPDDPIRYYDLKMEKTLGIWRRKLPQILEDYISRIGVRRVFGALSAKYYEAVAGAQGRLSGVEFRRYEPCNPGRGQRRALEALGHAVIDLIASDFEPDSRWKQNHPDLEEHRNG